MKVKSILKYIILISLISCVNKRPSSHETEENNEDLFVSGENLMAVGNYRKAIACFSKQIYLTPSVAALYEQRAIAYSEINKHDSAVIDMDVAIKLNPQNLSSLLLRGQLKYGGRYYKEALMDFDSLLKRDAHFTEAWANKGITLLKLDRKADACDCFSKALANGDRDAPVLISRNCKQ